MKDIFKIGILLSCFTTWSQVGIGTHKPDESAALEIRSADKGMLLPVHSFKVFNDKTFPINDPAVGTLVYNNISGVHDDQIAMKGIYVWDGERWNQLLNSEGADKLVTVRMMGGTDDKTQEVLIKEEEIGANNYINFVEGKTEVTSTFSEVIEVDKEVVTIPKGFYRIEVSIDGWNNGDRIQGNQYFIKEQGVDFGGLGLYVKECVLTDEGGKALVEPKISTVVSKDYRGYSIQGYTFTFFLKVDKAEQKVKVRFNNAPGTSHIRQFRVNQNGISVKFRRYFD